MAYADPSSKTSGDIYTLADWNTFRDNWLASAVRAMDTKGDLAVGTGANALARLAVGADDTILVPDTGETTGLAWQIQPACRVYNSADIDPTVDSWETLTFDSERFDTDGMHDTGANTERLTVPTNGDGIYLIGGSIEVPNDTAGEPVALIALRIQLNGSTVIERYAMDVDTTSPLRLSIRVSTLYALSATDYVILQCYLADNYNVKASANYSPEFWAIWLRRQ